MILKMLLLSVVLSLTLVVDASNKSICNLCECYGGDVYHVSCNEMPFNLIPPIEKDRKIPWKLEIEKNLLKEIPTFIKLENLTSLSLQRNLISVIQENAFRNLTNLTSLSLSYNSLTALSFDSNSFKGPYEDKLPNPLPLKSLDLSHNQIRRLPESVFKHLPNLTKLDLSSNPFIDLSKTTAQAISQLHNLKQIDLSCTQLQRLPDHFFAELTSLIDLDLSGNNFIMIPAEINYARSLRTLYINNNTFGALFENSFWESLKDLEILHMTKSKSLFEIGDGVFGNLTSLKKLYLNNNAQLSILTQKSFTNRHNQTPHIEELHLQNNALETLPENALPWNDIRILNLKNNPWNCDCKLEWLVKGVMRSMGDSGNYRYSLEVLCANPVELLGQVMTSTKVQETKLVCSKLPRGQMGGYGFLVIATIVVGTILLVTGTFLFSYILFRRAKVQDWLGNNVKYRRTLDEDEIVTSTTQY